MSESPINHGNFGEHIRILEGLNHKTWPGKWTDERNMVIFCLSGHLPGHVGSGATGHFAGHFSATFGSGPATHSASGQPHLNAKPPPATLASLHKSQDIYESFMGLSVHKDKHLRLS